MNNDEHKHDNEISLSSFFDEKFLTHPKHYILQSLLIFVCISSILLLYRFFGGIVVASLGASSFIVFITPHTEKADVRYVIGGYICGSAAGVLFGLLRGVVAGLELAGGDNILVIISAAAVAVATFVMVVTNTEHPPAAALALGLSVDPQHWKTALAAIAGVSVICIFRKLLRKQLIDLL